MTDPVPVVSGVARTDPRVEAAQKAVDELTLQSPGRYVHGTKHRDDHVRVVLAAADAVDPMRKENWSEWDGLTFGQLHSVYVAWRARCERAEAEVERLREELAATKARESWTAEDIIAAYKRHASNDDWGVPSFYDESLLAALRGEYDHIPRTES